MQKALLPQAIVADEAYCLCGALQPFGHHAQAKFLKPAAPRRTQAQHGALHVGLQQKCRHRRHQAARRQAVALQHGQQAFRRADAGNADWLSTRLARAGSKLKCDTADVIGSQLGGDFGG